MCSCFPSADPILYFAEDTVYVSEGSKARLVASLYTTAPRAASVQWYHQNTPIWPHYDTHYMESRWNSSNRLVLTVKRVGLEELGMYTVVVSVGRVTRRASVTLMHSSTVKARG